MTTALAFFVASLVARWAWVLMTWGEARAHSQMLRAVARAKHKHRSRPAPGFDVAPDIVPQASAATRVGVEPASSKAEAPPAPQILVGADAFPPQAAPTRTHVLLSPTSPGGRRAIPPTSSALAGLDRWCPQ